MSSSEVVYWNLAMQEEMKSLNKNRAWDWVIKRDKFKLIGSKWIFKKKD